MELYDKIQECVSYIQSKINSQPKVGIILGSGLSNLANEIEVTHTLSYNDLPHRMYIVSLHFPDHFVLRSGNMELLPWHDASNDLPLL